jgi:hypothetical protein
VLVAACVLLQCCLLCVICVILSVMCFAMHRVGEQQQLFHLATAAAAMTTVVCEARELTVEAT